MNKLVNKVGMEVKKKYTNKNSRSDNMQVHIPSYIFLSSRTDFMIDVGMSTCTLSLLLFLFVYFFGATLYLFGLYFWMMANLDTFCISYQWICAHSHSNSLSHIKCNVCQCEVHASHVPHNALPCVRRELAICPQAIVKLLVSCTVHV